MIIFEPGLEFIPPRGNSRIGRWLSVDPLTEMYPGWCPYNYCMNNPLKFIDPDGKAPGDLTAKKRAFYGGVGASIVRVAESHGIKKEQALYMVSQRLQENGWRATVPGNNLFNIKGASASGTMKLITKEEDSKGNSTTITANFRVYENLEEAVGDYLNVLQTKFPGTYDALIKGGSIEEFTTGLQSGSLGKYATDADYQEKLHELYKQVSEEYQKFETEKEKEEKK